MVREITLSDPVTFIPDFLNAASAEAVYTVLRNEIGWERRPDAPRSEYWTNWFGRSYTYGRGAGVRTYESRPQHDVITDVNDLITFKLQSGRLDEVKPFEGCFLNMYENSRDSLGWHADDDPGIDHSRPIAVVTLGNGRPLRFRSIADLKDVAEIFLSPGSLLLMHAGMQSTHHHAIPKVGYDVGPRISMTYRGLIENA